jgi:hypothetical protein
MRYLILTTLMTLTAFAAMLPASSVLAEGWGNVKGRFVYDGPAPKPAKFLITADKAFCSKHAPKDDTILVGKNGELANVVVYVYTKSTEKIDIHEDYEDLEDEAVVLSNSKCAFSPHVAVMWNKQKLVLKNADSVAHNTKVDFFANAPFNIQIPAGASITKQLPKGENLPTRISCGAHPWMRSILVVRSNPYVTVTDKDGKFELENVPEGDRKIQFWHEKWGYLSTLHIGGKKVSWKRGRAEVEIEDEETVDFGEIKLNPTDYKK